MTPEWDHSIKLADADKRPLHIALKATNKECEALAKRFEVLNIHALQGHLCLTKNVYDDLYHLKGDMTCDLEEECVISLKPFRHQLNFSLDLFVSPYEIEQDEDDERDIEVAINGHVNVGEIVAQYLLLSLDPYPQAPDVYQENTL